MHSLCIISHSYPGKRNLIAFPFVREFAHAAARHVEKVSVIAPLPIHLTWQGADPVYNTEITRDGIVVDVYRPRYISTSDRQVWKWNTAQIGLESFCRSAGHILKSALNLRPDALYGHFLYRGGAAAVRLGKAFEIPAFPMVGDGLLNTMDPFGIKRGRSHFSEATAFMTNSSDLAGMLHQKLGVIHERIGVFPNGIDHQIFYPRNRAMMRKKLALPQDRFIVVCVGHQDFQKGPVRVGVSIRGLEGVSGVFLGTGPDPPQAENILYNGPIPHEHVPDWLSAADVFALPSTYEGCCNAALEAMACGLPVISSTGAFNDDILNSEVSIRLDPLDVPSIRSAVIRLRDDKALRFRMGEAALKWSMNFDGDFRARRMLEFMAEQINRRQS